MIGYPVVNGATVPAVGPVQSASDLPFTNVGGYRTISGDAIVAAASGQLQVPGALASVDLTVGYARSYLAAQLGLSTGQLIDMTNGVPSLVASGVNGYAVQYDGAGIPMVSAVPADAASTVSPDADLLWLYRTFGKR